MAKKPTRFESEEQDIVQATLKNISEELSGVSLMGVLSWGAQRLLTEATIAEVTNYLGRPKYQRSNEDSLFRGERNGFRETTIDSPIGPITYNRQRVANAPDFHSRLHVPYMRRPQEFADAIAEMYVQGVSTRKIKTALKAVTGEKARLSRSSISRITEKLREEFREWKTRDLAELDVAYLFLDAIRIGIRLENTRKDSVLVAYAVLKSGEFQLIHLGIGHSESDSTWGNFLNEMKSRGLKDPLLVISDGNRGVINAIDSHFPTSYRQRCVKHKIDNVLDTIPKEKHDEVRAKLNQIFYGATSLEQAKEALKAFKREYAKVYPSAVSCLDNDIDQALTFYLFPVNHW